MNFVGILTGSASATENAVFDGGTSKSNDTVLSENHIAMNKRVNFLKLWTAHCMKNFNEYERK